MMIRKKHQTATLRALGVVALLGASMTGCGDDTAAASPSTTEFCVQLQQLDQGEDSGPYAEFYDKHPDPTLEDWATDGHLVTDAIQASIDQFKSFQPSEEAQPMVDDLLEAFDTMKQNSTDVVQAGKDGDQAAYDELERVNQGTNVPAIMASIDAITQLCGASAGS